jgi:hypothetical protein
MITIPFEITDDSGAFVLRDAIILPDDHTCTNIEIEIMKQKRFDDWILILNTPSSDITDEQVVE